MLNLTAVKTRGGTAGWQPARLLAASLALRIAATAMAAAVVLGCGGDSTPMVAPGNDGYTIRTAEEDVGVSPNASRSLTFFLLDRNNQPASGRVVSFEITDPVAARGASLSMDRGLTSAQGAVELQLIAGLAANFKLKVSAEGAPPLFVLVFVSPEDRGPVEIAPLLLAAPTVVSTIAQVRLTLVHDSVCAAVNRAQPRPNVFDPRAVAPGGTTIFRSVSTERNHAVVGQALDAAGMVRLDGCVDLPGAAILEEGLMRLTLPLYPAPVSPVGRYRAASYLSLQGMPRPVMAVTRSWAELTACRFDPGRLWLDCTVDALGADSEEDPLDCVPSGADEAAFESRLAALRGLPLRDPARPMSRCRQSVDGAGRPSLEAQVEGMFAARNPRVNENLKSLAAEVAGLLTRFRLSSTMTVTATTDPTRFQLDHQLDTLDFATPTEPISLDLLPLGLPLRTARFVSVQASGNELAVERHGFTLRLGAAARRAVEQAVLPRRGLPGTIPELVNRTFASATYQDRGMTLTGCFALSALICPLVQAPDKCVVNACERGVAALGKNLDQGFSQLNGQELDLFLEGFVQIIERDSDGKADALGFLLPGSGEPGVWVGNVLAGDEQLSFGGYFTGDRLRP